MAYCRSCGAYIPDGQMKCLACGFDESAETAKKEAAAAEQYRQTDAGGNRHYDSEELRRQLEKQREKQKENSRKWAEAERARRQQQDENRSSAKAYGAETGTARENAEKMKNSKGLAVISYIWGLWLIPLLFKRDDAFAMYHAKQGIVLTAVGLVAGAIGSIFGIGWVVSLARIYLMIRGMSNASSGKMEPLPYIGDIANKF